MLRRLPLPVLSLLLLAAMLPTPTAAVAASGRAYGDVRLDPWASLTTHHSYADSGAIPPRNQLRDIPREPRQPCHAHGGGLRRAGGDWFEDRTTSARAFGEVLGSDIDRIVTEPTEGLLRRARRVLECSGPVCWAVKETTYRTAMQLPALHPALFRGLRAGFHDVYGDLEPGAAPALLDGLDLPAGTEHLAERRHVLAAGQSNHHRSPGAWDQAIRSGS
ncbi:hypothetical protein ACFW6F_03110 [Streptomyces sp. NPDC058746]|uniref:hypothetical protein n=1 Tax=Streptomyces sp. NPDC058746 TaxID=3346622 RepID=UPI0036C2520E